MATTNRPLLLLRHALEQARIAAASGAMAEATRWFDRARRIAPEDDHIVLECALEALRLGRAEAAELFEQVARRHDLAEAWAGLAAAALRNGARGQARSALEILLRDHGFRAEWRLLADAVAGAQGWCALGGDGIALGPPGTVWRLDGAATGPVLAPGWQGGRRLEAMFGGQPLLGSPIRVDRIARLDGVVRRTARGVEGWAWHPYDPARDPVLVLPDGTTMVLGAEAIDATALPDRLLATPRRFVLTRAVHPGGPDGTRLPGAVGRASAMAMARPSSTVVARPPRRVPAPVRLRQMLLPARAALLPVGNGGTDWLVLPPGLIAPPGLEEALRRAAYAAPMIGIAASLPGSMDGVVRGRTVDVAAPPDGAVLFLRHDLLRAAGLRRAAFHGAGAVLTDLARRAGGAGWRCVVVPQVVHEAPPEGPATPGEMQAARQDAALLERLHPPAPDRLAALRRAALRRALAADRTSCVVLVGHAAGGGTARAVGLRGAALRAQGKRTLLLTPDDAGVRLEEMGEGGRALRFELPTERAALRGVLRNLPIAWFEFHHLLGHARIIPALPVSLGVPYDMWLHDRLAFGETTFLAGARRRVVPCADLRGVLRRATGLSARVVALDDVKPPAVAPGGPVRLVCVAGALGRAKGLEVLLDCARDSAARGLDLHFVLVGFSEDDEALLRTGRVHVTGPFAEHEAVALIRAQGAQLGFVPSIETEDWRETWCFALSHLWEAGLPAACFAIGAPRERMVAAGPRGGFLLRPGTSVSMINDALAVGMPVTS